MPRKAAGFDYIVPITILPRNNAGFGIGRNPVNAIMRSGTWQTNYGITAIVYFGRDAIYGTDAAAADALK